MRNTFVDCPYCTDPIKVKVARVDGGTIQSPYWYRLADYPASCPGCHRDFSGGIELTQAELAKAFNAGEA